ncbi:MAG: DUF3500 domain-containing protein [Planctomycetes bacterium]|nr:DUF3500 domain-containing protein [Planctomycetota bacterium]
MKRKPTERPRIEVLCPDCDPVSRRSFLRTVGGVVAAGTVGASVPAAVLRAAAPGAPGAAGATDAKPAGKDTKPAETLVKALYDSLKPEQRKIVCFPFDHELRSFISNNWNVVDESAGAIGKLYSPDQQEIIRALFKGVTSEEGHERFQKQMKDDAGGFDKYTCAIFGEPGTGKFEWVMTGRHLTIRADGDSVENTAFGGPVFYGHAVEFNEKPDHPGNVWWSQARMANEIYKSLDGKQQAQALLEKSPPDAAETVAHQGTDGKIPGLACAALGRDQKEMLEKTLKGMLGMYRAGDVEEALACLKGNGGLDALRLSFYKEDDLGADGIWDRWRLEGPAFVWYFRGSPHVHAWLHVAHVAHVAVKKARV